jgi:hypothetical protein
MLELARQLCLTLESPIWSAVRSAPPWRQATSQSEASECVGAEANKVTEPQKAQPLAGTPAEELVHA